MMMQYSLLTLFIIAVGYLLVLFAIAYAAEHDWLPAGVVRHPLTYVLSLGVYASSWTFYGSVGFARTQGYNFLTIYIGVTLAFMLAPVLLSPILRLTREFQLSSLADLFAFRYRSQFVGVLVTLFMLAGTLPYIALQIRAVTESMRVLTDAAAPTELAFGFCVTLTLFAILFGARHISAREKHEGLVVAIAFESIVKLIALLAAGLFAVFGIFGGIGDMQRWLDLHPEAVEALYAPVREGPWATLLLLSFSAAFLLPRQFHMTFTENLDERSLKVASWGLPAFLFLLNLPILPILWAGDALGLTAPVDYYSLGIATWSGSSVLPVIVFIGGVSAASAMMIVTTLALSAMALNHLLLPMSYPDPKVDIFRWVLWGRRMIIAVIIMLGYGFYLVLEHKQGLVQLGLISFVATAQFLPGIGGVFFWRRATRMGFIAGLLGGGAVWFLTLLAPLLASSGIVDLGLDPTPIMTMMGLEKWGFSTFWSLAINALLFVVVSLTTQPSAAETEAAAACCRETLGVLPGVVVATSPAEFREQLAVIIGDEAAKQQVHQALHDLGFESDERRPGELRRLRDRIERNLSGLLGPALARIIVDQRLTMDISGQTDMASNVRLIEQQLELSNTRLQGLAAELDTLRRYHRQILQDIPLGVCSIGSDQEVVVWNLAMQIISGIGHREAVGTSLSALPAPWGRLLSGFMDDVTESHIHKHKVIIDGQRRWLNLHKSHIEGPIYHGLNDGSAGTVLLVEDLTEIEVLEAELAHSERLASIGRLAAGVAHEIGNPVTGIACIAQNLRADGDDELMSQGAEEILKQTRRINNIVQSLVSFSHGGEIEEDRHAPFNLYQCAEEAMQLVRLSRDGKQMQFENICHQEIEIVGNRQRFSQVFVNLLSNACDASRPGTSIRIESHIDNDELLLRVLDEGEGISPEIMDRVLDPFFTTKPPGKGTGLGLPLAYNIVRQHRGSLSFHARKRGGTAVHIRLAGFAEGGS